MRGTALIVIILISGCLGAAPTTSDGDVQPQEEANSVDPMERSFPKAEEAVWFMPVTVSNLSLGEDVDLSNTVSDPDTVRIANLSARVKVGSPAQIALVPVEGDGPFFSLTSFSVPYIVREGERVDFESVLHTNRNGTHLLVVAYQGQLDLRIEPGEAIEDWGAWQESRGRFVVMDDRVMDTHRSGVGTPLPGPSAYSYEADHEFEGTLFGHSAHRVHKGLTEVRLSGPHAWGTGSQQVVEGTRMEVSKLALPPGFWTAEIDVYRDSGFHSTGLVEVPEGPALPFNHWSSSHQLGNSTGPAVAHSAG